MTERVYRPYFNNSILELEVLFYSLQSQIAALQILDQELSHRQTERAERLHGQVKRALADLEVKQVNQFGSARSAVNSLEGRTTHVDSLPKSASHKAPPLEEEVNAKATTKAVTPPLVDLGKLSTFPVPKDANEPTAILAAWIALEALSPQTYRRPKDLAAGDSRCVVDLSDGQVPWGRGERSRPSKKLFYQVILGSIMMGQATNDLVKAFGADEELSSPVHDKAAIAAVLVDKDGIALEDGGIAISSFAWALPLALKLKLGSLGAWPRVEPQILERLTTILCRFDEDGKPIALDLATINIAHRWLVDQFSLPEHMIEPPSFALRVYHYFKAKNPPEASLLNSFFLRDLSRAAALVERNAAPAGLRRYLGIERPMETFDLLTDRVALECAVAPANMPAARWPSPGGHPLVILQQAAVNLTRSEFAGAEGIAGVNGPPGTGKTTLLRDVVAACVLDRALAMATFDDPNKAFSASGEKMLMGERAFFQLYTLDRSLKGHEILVASSNNKAVENVSKELPAVKAVGRSTDELSYFKSVSDVVHGRSHTAEGADEDNSSSDPVATWGLIAAVLGNVRNRAAFQQSFWWDEEFAFRIYLKAVKGDPIVREIRDPESGNVERRTPLIVPAENPPTPQLAKINWRKAGERLLSLKREVDAELRALEEIRQTCLQLAETNLIIVRAEGAIAALVAQRKSLEEDKSQGLKEIVARRKERDQFAAEVRQHRQSRPGFFALLFRSERWKAWSKENRPLVEAKVQAEHLLEIAERKLTEVTGSLNELIAKVRKVQVDLTIPRQRAAQLGRIIDAQRGFSGEGIVDGQFFARRREASNLDAPWIPDSLHRKREDLFVAAVAVHRAFIDASAQKFLHNLSVLMNFFSSGPTQDESKRKLLGDLWSTLFLVVPVISTTFASVDHMLGDLPVGSIGWLLIDEAGQAMPQAAVGAIMRSKRAIVVGDPLQIAPIVSLPERLNSEICKFFKITKSLWAAPEASAQTLADQASRFQATFRSDHGPRRVGIPLLVHRRCQEPMFRISNRIAYDDQMVHAAGPGGTTTIGAALGPSIWIDVDGEADSKWCPAEGELTVEMLKRIAAADITDPDLFIITPFRIVAQQLRQRLESEIQLFSDLHVNPREWVNNRIGTIHTVQGREAAAVILVLGAPTAAHQRARNWAAGTPNILNVAVSRARHNLYVIGSYGAWSGVGHARELASSLRDWNLRWDQT